ncbi:hypothetical protein ARMA_1763 [Ardenticatena maritima]|uniref:Uncharacterized protein n=1 Tax=Ardenticatena maritima TaxID=872965 RepID=A0A0M9UCX4_9CHLR|nr:hypothetical protein ARMA_1763 [Ardenticatena maritima]
MEEADGRLSPVGFLCGTPLFQAFYTGSAHIFWLLPSGEANV